MSGNMSFNAFISKCEEVRDIVSKMRHPLIVNHYDADGLASAGLVGRALKKMGKWFRIRTLRQLTELDVKKLSGEKELIFLDLGGGMIDHIEENLKDSDIIIMDHHQTRESSVLQVNPELFGFDGGKELSSSGTAYFVFQNPELAHLGIVGAVGDMQTPLTGLNLRVVDEGKMAGVIRTETDLTLFGRVSRPLLWFLAYSTDPYLPGLTGRRKNCAILYDELGIPLKDDSHWRRYYELSQEERISLISALVAYSYQKGLDDKSVRKLIGTVYSFPLEKEGTELRDANEYSTLLNACGRHGRSHVGIGVCLGDEKAYEKARDLLIIHRKMLRDGVIYAHKNVEDYGSFYFLDGRGVIGDNIIGIVAGMLYGSGVRRNKPILAITDFDRDTYKVSARATRNLVGMGLNLGKALSKVTEGMGMGGGHSIAAGAQIRKDGLNQFLLSFSHEIRNQLKVG